MINNVINIIEIAKTKTATAVIKSISSRLDFFQKLRVY